jgi:glucose-6-phosphate isomerase
VTAPNPSHTGPSSDLRRDFFTASLGSGSDFILDAHCLDLPADWAQSYDEPLAKAHAAMVALEAGAIANPDENRMVGHYWLRAPERAPTPELRAEITACQLQIHSFAAEVHRGQVRGSTDQPLQNLLTIGIGGSTLGPQLAAAALGGPGDRLRPFFFDNVDPDGMDRVLHTIASTPAGLAGTLVLVVSKSGGTKETRNGQLHAQAAFSAVGLDFGKHAVAVTGTGSELWTTATKGQWRAIFPMWDWVGGRTSELSAVGLLPAALQGVDIEGMLAGARAMDELTRRPEPTRNPAMLLAVGWHQATGGRGLKDMVILPYKDRLELFSRYLQQLVMESLGKEFDLGGQRVHQGISVYGNKGSTDQHAYVQQLRDGVNNFFATFIEVSRDREHRGVGPAPAPDLFVEEGATSGDYLLGFLLGTQQALYEKGRKSVTITVSDCSPFTLGLLIALYERTVGIYAQLVGINAYHQPGVEAGKKAAAAVLTLQRQLLVALTGEPRLASELAAACGGDAFTAFKILEHLGKNGRLRRDLPDGAESPLQARYSKL